MSGVSASRQTLAFPPSGLRLLLFPPLQVDFPPPRGLKKDWTQNRASLLNCQAFNCSLESPGGCIEQPIGGFCISGRNPGRSLILSFDVEDPASRAVGSDGPGASPIKLIGTTIGDELRLESNFQSKVIAISLKDRAAVSPGGHTANAAYWYDPKNGHFVSSNYYMQTLPSWVAAFNDSSTAMPYCGKAWEALPETPGTGGEGPREIYAPPNQRRPAERFVRWLEGTPYMNEMELKLAAKAVKAERLGQRPATDLLA